jgi:hypothetical protein
VSCFAAQPGLQLVILLPQHLTVITDPQHQAWQNQQILISWLSLYENLTSGSQFCLRENYQRGFFYLLVFEIGSGYAAKAGLELLGSHDPPPSSWDHHLQPHPQLKKLVQVVGSTLSQSHFLSLGLGAALLFRSSLGDPSIQRKLRHADGEY